MNYHDVLMHYTMQGYRVIALAWRQLGPRLNYVRMQRAQREELEQQLDFLGLCCRYDVTMLSWHRNTVCTAVLKCECCLHFVGLLVMENRLKVQTTPVIRQLKLAAIRPVMVTGTPTRSACFSQINYPTS